MKLTVIRLDAGLLFLRASTPQMKNVLAGIGRLLLLYSLYFVAGNASAQSPGGVSVNLKLWLKANAGVLSNTQGANVTDWADQTAAGNSASYSPAMFSQSVISPKYQTNAFNFNPTVRFPGTGSASFSALEGAFTTPVNTTTTASAYAVFTMNATTGNTGRVFMISQDGSVSDATSPTGANFISRAGAGSNNIWGTRSNTNATSVGPVVGLPVVMASSHFATAGGGQVRLNFNGGSFSVNGFSLTAFNSSYYRLGISTTSANDWLNGDIAEVILYTADQSSVSANHSRIESYLAIKYGIHKTTGDYVNSAGTTIWNATTNAAYHNDVFGIGLDNSSALNQTQSNSMNTGSGDGTGRSGLGNITIRNPSALTNLSFLLIGHNTNDFSTVSTGLPPGSSRFNRIWKAQTTGTTGSVTLQFDATGLTVPGGSLSNLQILIDNDGDGNFTTGSVIPITATSVAGNVVQFNNITFPASASFSFGLIPGPGGVSGSVAWYKANAGVTVGGGAVSQWNDFSGSNNNANQISPSNQPLYTNNAINFHQSLTFNAPATARYMGSPANGFPAGSAARSVFLVASSANTQTANGWIFGYAPNGSVGCQTFTIGKVVGNNALYASGFSCDAQVSTYNFWGIANQPKLATLTYSTPTVTFFDAGQSIGTFSQGSWNTIATQGRIGVFPDGAHNAELWSGNIAEIIMYPSVVTGLNQQKVESYLAIKYGIHKAGSYVSSAGATIWDATANAAYHNDVFGIGQDDADSLKQVQSNSMNTGSGNGIGQSGKGNIVISNPSTLTNNSFLLIGHTVNDFSLINTNMPVGIPPSYSRLNRSWRSESTGTTGTVTLSFDATGIATLAGVQLNTARLLIDRDADGNFATGTSTVIPVSSVSGNVITFNNVSFSPTVFTLAFELPRLTVSGMVWDDANGNLLKEAAEVGTNAGNTLFVNLIDRVADTLVASAPVAANGTYSLAGAAPQNTSNTYTLVLTTTATAHTPALPVNFVHIGQDSTGKLIPTSLGALNINTLSANLTNLNFGIEQLPISTPISLTEVDNLSVFTLLNQPGYLGASLSTPPLEPLSGTDPEDCPGGCSAGRDFVIEALLSNTLIFYDDDGAGGLPPRAIAVGDTIRNFNTANMTVYGLLGEGTASNPVGFDYSYIDAARKVSLTSAAYRITTKEPLPVTIISFTAQKEGCNSVRLNWEVDNAINFSHFVVERNTDGSSFTYVTKLPYLTGQNSYGFQEKNIANGSYQYRLRLVDTDGSYKFSTVTAVIISCATNNIVVIPNPAQGYIYLKGLQGKAEVRILNMQGKEVLNVSGVNDLQQININKLPAATYLVQIIKEGHIIATVPMVKQH